MRLEGNRDGGVRVRQPIDDGEGFVTRRIFTARDADLPERSVGEGDCLPTDLRRLLRRGGWLYSQALLTAPLKPPGC